MESSNWIALAAVLITTFGSIVIGGYHLIKLMIKSSSDDQEIERLKDKIEQLRDHIRDMN